MSTPLHEAALIGDGRDGALGVDALDELAPADTTPEQRLLLKAGAFSIYRRAGALAEQHALPPSAPEETLPACSAAVARIMTRVFSDEGAAMLPEALQALRERGLRLPHTLLPTALTVTPRGERQLLSATVGARGQWLAGLNPEWSFASSGDWLGERDWKKLEALWEDGTRAQRAVALRGLRAQDPGRARDLLAEGFKKEGAEERLAFLECLRVGLSMEDEPLLEDTLTDRSQKVRAAAARLLHTLPESRLVQRVAERARAWLGYEAPKGGAWATVKAVAGRPRAGKMRVDVPAEFDKAWARDGIVEAPPKGVGRRAHWLAQTLAAVAPDEWAERLGADATALIAAALADDYAAALLEGLSRAALNHEAAGWMGPLFDAWAGHTPLRYANEPHPRSELLARMPAADAHARALKLLDGNPEELRWLEDVPAPWPEALGRALLVAACRRPEQFHDNLLEYAALAIPPGCRASAPAAPDVGEDAPWQRQHAAQRIAEMYALLDLRRRFYEELDRDHPQ